MATSPGAGALDLRVLITAQNTASPEFQKVQKDAQDTQKVLQETGKAVSGSGSAGMQDLAKHTEATGKSLREVIGPLRLFSSSIASEVSPALGSMVQGLGAATREGAKFSLAISASIIATTIAATGIAAYIGRLNALTLAQNEANFAAKGFDASAIRGQLDATVKAMDEFDLSWKNKIMNKLWPDPKVRAWADTLYGALVGKPDPRALEAQKQAFATALPFEDKLAFNQLEAAYRQAEAALSQLQASRAEQLGDMKLFSALEDKIAAALDLESVALQKVIAYESELLRIRAERRDTLGTEGPGITEREDVRRRAEMFRSETRLRGLDFARSAAELRMSNRLGVQDTFAGSQEDAAIRGGVLFAAESAARRAANDASLVSAEAQARTQVLGLTRQQRVEAELGTIEAAKQLAYAQAKGKLDEDQLTRLADLQAQMKQQAVLQQELATQNPFEGFKRGIEDVVDTFTASGQLMRDEMRNLGNDMSRTLGDTFFSVVTGNFKKLSELPQAFAQAMLRSFTDVLGKMVIGNIFGSIQQSFGGGLRSFIPAAGMLGGGGGGGGLLQVGGQLFQQVQAGGGQTVLVPVGAAGAGTAGGGGFNFANMPSLPTGSFGSSLLSGTNLGAMWNAPLGALLSGDVVFSGGQLIHSGSELALAGIESASIAGSSGFAGAGISLSTAAGGIASAIGLGLTIYSALQGPPTFQNIAISTTSGALSGAMLGASIDVATGGATFGAGMLIGAIAGALLGGGAASFGKGGEGKKTPPSERSFQAGQAGAAALGSAIASSQTLEDLRAILNANWSPYNEVVIISYDIPTHWVGGGYTNGTPGGFIAYPIGGRMPYPDIVTMLADPRYVENLEIQVAGPAGGGSAAYAPALTTQFQDKWHERLRTLAKGQFGFREDLGPLGELIGAAPSATGFASVERLSVLSGTELFGRGRGQQLDISPDVLARAGLDADQIEQFLRLALQVDKDRNLNILVRPEQFAF